MCFFLSLGQPVQALSINEFFSIDYSARFSTQNVTGDSPFRVTVTGSAVCTSDLTAPYDLVSEARITGRIIAVNRSNGDSIILNPSYTLNISPFPLKAGESTESSETLELQFAPGAPSGEYDIEGHLVEGKVKAVFWLDVTEYLPSLNPLGTVSYTQPSGSGGASGGKEVPDPLPTSSPAVSVPDSPAASSPAAETDGPLKIPEPTGSVPVSSPVVQAPAPPAVPAAETGVLDSGLSPAPAPEEPVSSPWLVLGLVIIAAVALGGGLSWFVFRGRNNRTTWL
ncbi:MAG: hypothetical protein PHU23_01050 [Dehalococcoidales bacterium]|nr:hypothetical protein [Dehalococcoidales bacterium]